MKLRALPILSTLALFIVLSACSGNVDLQPGASDGGSGGDASSAVPEVVPGDACEAGSEGYAFIGASDCDGGTFTVRSKCSCNYGRWWCGEIGRCPSPPQPPADAGEDAADAADAGPTPPGSNDAG